MIDTENDSNLSELMGDAETESSRSHHRVVNEVYNAGGQ
jgi:hypothetical protein